MDRRGFFSRLGLGTLALRKEIVLMPETPETIQEYKGFRLHWTGWMQAPTQMVLLGHWFAASPKANRMAVASCYPGKTQQVWPGQILDLSLQEGQEFPLPTFDERLLNKFMFDAYCRLISFIDANYEDLVK